MTKSSTQNRRLNNKGFSLAEIMIVLVIIGGIMALILPKIVEGQDNANIRNTRIKLGEIENKLNQYQADCGGKLPSDLNFLVEDSTSCRNWTSNKASQNLMKDAWGSDFQYEALDNGYNLYSLGKNKKDGGSGPDKDIYSESSVANQEGE
ncbi:type II secretion system protein GspG [Pseudobdellovibrio exovorus]|uniref:General secretion pathway protein G n=1 Tax=Pseudobdellovibrio exovorus JSS TaxID=1184267 RepID=M4VB82_9BACT|nr:type II secretion system protein GspG [Pseudobdellovibrio exovorus]AGH95740.1 general secretion pathway protein G precursor [Pseudobdellovibrio exovorus JSS]